jgi:integrase
MRDTFATLSLTAGVPVEWISKQLGHASVETTLRHYARWQPAADDRIVRILNAAQAATGLKSDSSTAGLPR